MPRGSVGRKRRPQRGHNHSQLVNHDLLRMSRISQNRPFAGVGETPLGGVAWLDVHSSTRRFPMLVDPMHLKHHFCQIDPNGRNLHGDAPFQKWLT
jgi:hypothetical protein